jgi:hypothetical protein
VVGELQLVVGAELPVELPEDAVGGEFVGELRGDAHGGLVVPLVLVGAEEPQLVLDDRAGELEGGVVVLVAGVGHAPVLGLVGVAAGEAVGLEVEVRVAVEGIRALPGDDVEDRALHVAVFGGRPHREDLDLLDGVGIGPGPGGAR